MEEKKERLVLYDRKEDVGIITFNRPKSLNAMNEHLLLDLEAVATAAKADKGARVFIIKGEGRGFCAGADIKEDVTYASPEEFKQRFEMYADAFSAIRNLDRPIIAQIQGYAVGAGLELALYCDLTVAAEDAKMGFSETRVGGVTGSSATYLLPRMVGIFKAKELVLTADFIDGKEAERIGMVNKAVPAEELEKVTWELAKKIAGNYPLEVRLAREAIDRGIDNTFAWSDVNSIRDACESYGVAGGARMKGMAEARDTAHKRLEETKK